ncbi:hypothetical protein ACFLQL_01365 [Verrucomicrobiota bacterium]
MDVIAYSQRKEVDNRAIFVLVAVLLLEVIVEPAENDVWINTHVLGDRVNVYGHKNLGAAALVALLEGGKGFVITLVYGVQYFPDL